MKLHLRRETKEKPAGCFGGQAQTLFVLHVRLETSPAELDAIKKQKLDQKVLSEYFDELALQRNLTIPVSAILNGENTWWFANTDVCERVAQEITEGCKVLKSYVEGAAGFGGSESIEL